MITSCQRLLLIAALLFQLSFADLLGRTLEHLRTHLITVSAQMVEGRVSEGFVRPTPGAPQIPCAVGLSYPPVVVCPTSSGVGG